MANMPYKIESYGAATGILMYPDQYQAHAQTFLTTDKTATNVNGRKIIKAGTIWPANDNTAVGVVFADVDVTDGTATGALIFEGTIKVSKLPAEPQTTAKTVLTRITFVGTPISSNA